MFAMTLALGAAGGGEVFGWKFPNPTKVLWVDGEQSERDLKKRFAHLATGIPGFDGALASKNLTVMARTAQTAGVRFLDVGSVEQAVVFCAEVERHRFGLAVFDNLSTLSDSIDDENSAAAFKPVQHLLTRLKKLNVAVIVAHHAGKDPSRGYRGSSAVGTTFERILGLVKDQVAPASRIEVMVKLEKFRDEIPEGFQPTFPLKFSTVEEGPEKRRVAKWDVGQLTKLDESWRMFSAGTLTTIAAFIAWHNERFGETRSAKNFGRDFKLPWMTQLLKTDKEIQAAERRMRALRQCEAEQSEDDEGSPAGAGARDF